jgi:hypothetical protein
LETPRLRHGRVLARVQHDVRLARSLQPARRQTAKVADKVGGDAGAGGETMTHLPRLQQLPTEHDLDHWFTLLERWAAAEDAFWSGLSVDVAHRHVRHLLEMLRDRDSEIRDLQDQLSVTAYPTD